jgi:hypothetical protein
MDAKTRAINPSTRIGVVRAARFIGSATMPAGRGEAERISDQLSDRCGEDVAARDCVNPAVSRTVGDRRNKKFIPVNRATF